MAAIAGHAPIVKYMMSLDQLAITCNTRNKNALDLAIEYGWENVAMVIIGHDRYGISFCYPPDRGFRLSVKINR